MAALAMIGLSSRPKTGYSTPAGDDGGSQAMLGDVFEARGQAQQSGFVDTRLPVDGHESRLAFGQRAGLVHHKRRDLLQHLETALHHIVHGYLTWPLYSANR